MSQTVGLGRHYGMNISPTSESPSDAPPVSSRYDVVVVGGGLAGLTAAAFAARGGATTLVIEPHALGGRARTDTREGYRLNRGAHALYGRGLGVDVLKRLNIAPQGHKPSTNKAMGLRNGRLLPLPVGAAVVTTKLVSLKGKAQLARELPRIGKLNPADYADRSVNDWLAGLGLSADADAMLRTLLRTGCYTEAFDDLSADVAIMQNQASAGGVLYLDGGWEQLIHAIARVAREAGAEFLNDMVAKVEPNRVTAGSDVAGSDTAGSGTGGSGAVVVECRAHTMEADAVIIATGSPAATRALLPGINLGIPERVVPARVACLDLALRRPPEHRFVLGVGRPLYSINHAPPAALAPDGGAVLHTMRYLGPQEQADADSCRSELRSLVEAVGVKADDIVYERYLHNMIATSLITTPDTGGLAGRPSVAQADAPGVFLAGDWVGAKGWLADASLASGEQAAQLALRIGARLR